MIKKARAASRLRRGSQIAEASLVYPVIIVVSVMSVAAMVHFYSCSAKAAAMSIDARSTADDTARSVKRTGEIYDAVKGRYDAPASGDDGDNNGYYDAAYSEASGGGNGYSITEESGLLYGKIKASYTAKLSMSGMFSASRSDAYMIQRSAVNEAQLIWKKQLISGIFGGDTIGDDTDENSAAGSTENE